MSTVEDILRRQISGRLAAAREPEMSTGEKALGTVRSGLSGMTFGWADELGVGVAALAAAATTGKSPWKIYREMKTNYDVEQSKFETENPKTALAAKVAGGIATGTGVAKALPGLAARPFLGGAALGTGMGATTGAGEAETLADVPIEAAKGGALGGALGLAVPVGLKAIGAGLRGAKNLMVPKSKAGQVIAEALEREGLSPAQVASRMRQLGDEAVLADVGENVRGVARAVTATPGAAKSQASTVLKGRMRVSQERLLGEIRKATGSDKGFYSTLKESVSNRIAQARPLYKKAELDVVPEERIASVVSSIDDALNKYQGTTIGRALSAVKSRFMAEGKIKTSIGQLDAVKKDIDDIISTAGRSGKGNLQSELINIQKQLLQHMDDSSPSYQQARAIWGGEVRMEKAMQEGLKILSKDADVTADFLEGLSKSERDAYVIGAMKAIRDKILSGAEGADASRKISSSLLKERLRPIFPDEKSFQTFARALDREQTFAQTRNVVVGGSPTARIQEEVSDLASHANVVFEAATGNPTSAAMRAVQSVLSRRKQIPEKLRKQLGEMLFTPGNQERVVQELRNRMKAKEIRQLFFQLQGALTAGSIEGTEEVLTR